MERGTMISWHDITYNERRFRQAVVLLLLAVVVLLVAIAVEGR